MSLDIAKYPTPALAENPEELRSLPKESLPKLCDELRQYLLNSVSRSSGHFASGLGTVELTVALHFVYNTPFDHGVGRRPPCLPAQNSDRPPRPDRHHSAKERPASLPVARRKRIRRAVGRPLVDLDQRRSRHGGGSGA